MPNWGYNWQTVAGLAGKLIKCDRSLVNITPIHSHRWWMGWKCPRPIFFTEKPSRGFPSAIDLYLYGAVVLCFSRFEIDEIKCIENIR